MAKKPAKGDGGGKGGAADAAGKPAPGTAAIGINAQYIKDLSFEVPGAPAVYQIVRDTQPDITVNINVNTNQLQDKSYEVVLEIRCDCKVKDQTAFILELQYAGVFTLNVPDEHVHPILLIECPRLLFPFARNILAEVSRDGGFPPVFLGIVDFAAMYQAKMKELQQSGAGKAPDGGAAA